jgi:demethylmenaquinone methyltransferase/2-methoxy-6-polyprenyl-1,4-benzoquinol methylase
MNSKSCVANQVVTAVRPHKDLPEFYAGRGERTAFVSGLFDNTARYYDRISAALSFGTCRSYRRLALRRAGLTPGMRMLDVATGTGLAAQAALDLGIPPADLIGIDPSRGMLSENRKLRPIPLVQGCGESLPFPDASFDFVCMGYALRHVEDLGVLFREFRRVLKPGGRVLILEISRPESRWVRAVAGFYLGKLLPTVTRWITGDAEAGRLIRFYWVTIDECVPPETIVSVLSSSGLSRVERRRMGGVLNDYLGIKLE